MRFGFQTILWGRQIPDLEEVLKSIHDAGFEGVEFAQAPQALGPFDNLIGLLDKHALQLVGLAGGSLPERMKYMPSRFRHNGSQPYMYIDHWEEGPCSDAIREGYSLALHPHYPGRATRLEYDWKLLEKHPELRWLPDTGHLFINWESLSDALTKYPDRLAAVHLKDWTPVFGRSAYRYAKGFIEPGKGDVPLDGVLEELKGLGYEGWVILELDYARLDCITSLFECGQWVARKRQAPVPVIPSVPPAAGPDPYEQMWAAATRTADTFYVQAAASFFSQLACVATSIWCYNASEDYFTLHAVSPDAAPFQTNAFKAGAYFSREASAGEAAYFSREASAGEAAYFSREVFAGEAQQFNMDIPSRDPEVERHRLTYLEYGVHRLLCLPVFATYNTHQVRYIVHYLLREECDPQCWKDVRERLSRLCLHFGRCADLYLTEIREVASAKTSLVLDEHQQSRTAKISRSAERREESLLLLARLTALVQEQVRCEGTTIFKLVEPGNKLIEGASTGIKWRQDLSRRAQSYTVGDHSLTASVLEERSPVLIGNVTKRRDQLGEFAQPKSWETVSSSYDVCMFAPFFGRSGKLLGVVRCRNKLSLDGAVRAFTEDDLALIDAIFQTASPILELVLAEDRRNEAHQKLFHELATPLVAIHSAVSLAKKEIAAKEKEITARESGARRAQAAVGGGKIIAAVKESSLTPLLHQDYLGDAQSWAELMRRLLNSNELLQLRKERIMLFSDVVAPAVRQVADLLYEKGISPKVLDYGPEADFKVLPPLWVDKNMFQQVFFNLLTNAIKYSQPQASKVKVTIRAERVKGGFHIHCRDNGLGIDPGWEEAIFEEGVRGDRAAQSDVQGRGLGLWMVRNVLKLHNAKIWLSSNHDPTEFTIFLPSSLVASR